MKVEDLPELPFQVAYREEDNWGLVVLVTSVHGIWFRGTVIVTPNSDDWKVGYVGNTWPNDNSRMRIL